MMRVAFAAVLAATAAPGAAEAPALGSSPAPIASAAPATAADAERLALARTAVDHVWPLGTYQRVMSSMMLDQMTGAMFDMKLGEMVPTEKMSEEDEKLADRTMGEVIAMKDPHFRERMRIMNKVMMAEMGPILTKVEPAVRDALATAYAKKFDVQQLADINRFFATPTGRAYAAESMMLFMDPEMMKAMMGMMPEIVKAMPAILEKVKAATAHLPEPPKDETESDEEGGEAQADAV